MCGDTWVSALVEETFNFDFCLISLFYSVLDVKHRPFHVLNDILLVSTSLSPDLHSLQKNFIKKITYNI